MDNYFLGTNHKQSNFGDFFPRWENLVAGQKIKLEKEIWTPQLVPYACIVRIDE